MQSMQVSLLGQRTGLERIEDGSGEKNWKDPLLPTNAHLTIFEALEPFMPPISLVQKGVQVC